MKVPTVVQASDQKTAVKKRASRSGHVLGGFAVFALLAGTFFGVTVMIPVVSADRETDTDNHRTTNPAKKTFAVTIRKPSGPPRVSMGVRDAHGNDVTAACSNCHNTRQPNLQNKTTKTLNEFHAGMSFSHGNVSCLSCHNENDYDALKLADGSRVEYSDVMTLCAQCHGPQMKAYEHGAHGGMNGYWDLSRGPQLKNNCVDCHNPHTPQFPKMMPTFKPKDRFLNQPGRKH